MEDISNITKSIDFAEIGTKIIHIEAMLTISLKAQAQIIANQEDKDFNKLYDVLLKEVANEAHQLFLNLPAK